MLTTEYGSDGGPGKTARVTYAQKLGWASCAAGLAFTSFNVIWATGNTWLVDTVLPAPPEGGSYDQIIPPVVQWSAIGLKSAASVLGILATTPARVWSNFRVLIRIGAWGAGICLTGYGLSQIAFFALHLTKILPPNPAFTPKIMYAHLLVWDMWFFIWGLLLLAATIMSRNQHEQ